MADSATCVNFVVPYRGRAEHLLEFVPELERFLPGSECRILVVEQADDKPFNKGILLNVGVSIVRRDSTWLVLHDVDMLPQDLACSYSQPPTVRHLAGALEQYGYNLPYRNYLGGVLTTTVDAYADVNGYSNQYWGWGSEDDDFLIRLWTHRVPFERLAGRYRSLAHPQAERSLQNMRLINRVLKATIEVPETSQGVDPRAFRRADLNSYSRRPGGERIFRRDGLSTVTYHHIGTRQLSRVFPFRTPVSPVHEIMSVAV